MRIRFCACAFALVASLAGTRQIAGQDTAGPTLVVMIVVDQLRGDLIDRYEEAFSGGFRRFLDHGYRFTSASHAHWRTHTAAGHATLATGVFPSRSGIVANNWLQLTGNDWLPTYAVFDPDSPILGLETVAQLPGRSPKNLLRTGLADWVRAADEDARTVSVSVKDRAAITLASKTDSNVYWMVPQLGRFVTSTFYADRYPGWVNDFNRRIMPGIAADSVWESHVPERFRYLARTDSATYEGPIDGERVHSTFPHLSSQETVGTGIQAHNAWAFRNSRSDLAVIGLAKAAIQEFDLGQRDHVDYLAISLSATDYVGHGFGPFSQEQLANLVHLDGILGEFFDELDEEVGEGAWVAALSADHGVATMPEYEQERGNTVAARLDPLAESQRLVTAIQSAVAGSDAPTDVAERLVGLLESDGSLERAYTYRELLSGEPVDSFAVLFRNSYHPDRLHITLRDRASALSLHGVEIRYPPGVLVGAPTGTTHGSPYWYDRHIPLMFLGAGVAHGLSDIAAYSVDVAPTLAALAGIPAPDDLDGTPIVPR